MLWIRERKKCSGVYAAKVREHGQLVKWETKNYAALEGQMGVCERCTLLPKRNF